MPADLPEPEPPTERYRRGGGGGGAGAGGGASTLCGGGSSRRSGGVRPGLRHTDLGSSGELRRLGFGFDRFLLGRFGFLFLRHHGNGNLLQLLAENTFA